MFEHRTKRHKIDSNIPKNVEQYALDLVPQPVLILERTTVYYANRSFARTFGQEAADLMELGSLSFLFQNFQAFLNQLHECEASGVERTGTFASAVHLHKSYKVTSSVWNSAFVCCIFSEDVPTLTPDQITEYRWLKLFSQNTKQNFSVLELDPTKKDNFFLALCDKTATRYKTSASNCLGKYLSQDLGARAEDVAWWHSNFIQLSPSQPTGCWEHLYRPSHGASFLMQVTGWYVEPGSAEGRHRVLIIVEDITAQRKLAEELEAKRKSIEELNDLVVVMKCIFDNSPLLLGAFLLETDDIVLELFNSAVHKEAGAYAASVGGSLRRMGVPQDILDEWRSCCTLAKDTSTPQTKEIRSFVDPTKIVSCCYVPFVGNKFCYIAWDITETKRMTAELKNREQQLELMVQARTKQLEDALLVKSNFLAVMSHEMRTPLSGIMGSLSLLSEIKTFTEEQRELVRIGQVCGEQLLVLITDLLDVAKIEQQKITLESEPFLLHAIVEGAQDVVSVDAEQKGIDIVCNFQNTSVLAFIGAPSRIRQVLINLLSNAVKFSDQGEVVLTVSATEARRTAEGQQLYEILFTVTDQGIGIASETKPKIFQPFTQADGSRTRRYGGTGLGLTISKKLAEIMGGTIWFDSELGQGSTFYFTIIVERTERTSIPTLASSELNEFSPLPTEIAKKKVLIATNGKAIQKSLVHIVQTWDLIPGIIPLTEIVSQASSADILLVDYKPNVLEVLEQLGNLRNRVIILGSIPKQMNSYNYTTVRKPVHLNTLRAAIENILKEHKTSAQPTNADQMLKIKAAAVRILLAEDNPMNQKVICKILDSFGYKKVVTAADGRAAYNIAKEQAFDIILMDIMMPEMTGIESTVCIREEMLPYPQPYIIALTADALEETKQKCLQVGMNEVLTKPVNRTELGKVLRLYSEMALNR